MRQQYLQRHRSIGSTATQSMFRTITAKPGKQTIYKRFQFIFLSQTEQGNYPIAAPINNKYIMLKTKLENNTAYRST